MNPDMIEAHIPARARPVITALTHALPDPARALLVEPDRVIGADLDAFTDRCGGEAVSALVGVIDLLASVHHGAGNIDTANALTDAAAHIEYTASDHARDARHA